MNELIDILIFNTVADLFLERVTLVFMASQNNGFKSEAALFKASDLITSSSASNHLKKELFTDFSYALE